MAPNVTNAYASWYDTSFSAKSIADLLSYSTRKMTRNATLLRLAFHTIFRGALLADMYTASFASYAMSCTFGRNCFHLLCNILCLCGQNCFAMLVTTAFASYHTDDVLCHHGQNCFARYARCLAMSCDVSRSLFSPLLYWWWRCPVPVEPDSH